MKPDIDLIKQQVRQALAEDIGNGDVTASLLDATQIAQAQVITREDAVICGQDWFDWSFQLLDESIQIEWRVKDADRVSANQILCTVQGPTAALLSAERCALNFLQTLSGTATTTQKYVDALQGTQVKILDTRKTIPGLRLAQKYAVTCAGGMNHRIGLYDMILIKENHIASCGSIAAALNKARETHKDDEIEIEVENLDELQQALEAGATRVLLDNFSPALLNEAVALNQRRAKLEVSGNITLDNIQRVAQTGIDYISCGAITKNVQAIDLSMQML